MFNRTAEAFTNAWPVGAYRRLYSVNTKSRAEERHAASSALLASGRSTYARRLGQPISFQRTPADPHIGRGYAVRRSGVVLHLRQ